jgi:GH15 family glucan-1,4-alpha-glucosidase
MASYQPIENYAVIGDLNTIALVGLHGSIDFLCFPNFDSPSIFAALLDNERGGYFQISPVLKAYREKQLYLPDTNVLLTRFLSSAGVAEITDFMPVEALDKNKDLVRIVSCVRGSLEFSMACCPRFDYARSRHSIARRSDNEFIFSCDDKAIGPIRLRSNVQMRSNMADVVTTFTLQSGDRAVFVLEYVIDGSPVNDDIDPFAEKRLYETINFWNGWVGKSRYHGRWMEIVNRSALVLKLMTSRTFGSIVASPTFGLPEEIVIASNFALTWDTDGDKLISKREMAGGMFYVSDANGDGKVAEKNWMNGKRAAKHLKYLTIWERSHVRSHISVVQMRLWARFLLTGFLAI